MIDPDLRLRLHWPTRHSDNSPSDLLFDCGVGEATIKTQSKYVVSGIVTLTFADRASLRIETRMMPLMTICWCFEPL